MRFLRTFYVSIRHNPVDAEETKAYNTLRTADLIEAEWAHSAVEKFLALHFDGAGFYRVRDEQPTTDGEGRLWNWWSAATEVSGQRVYVKEQIGGFDAKTISRATWRSQSI